MFCGLVNNKILDPLSSSEFSPGVYVHLNTMQIYICVYCRINLLIMNLKWIDQVLSCKPSSYYMCCDLVGSVGKSGALIVRYSQKKECMHFVFYYFENLSIATYMYNFGTTGPIQTGFSSKCTSPGTSPNEDFNQIENLKMSHVRLATDFPRSHHIYFLK